eukprot:scaffold12311_cov50-Cyclotella_meneghiniana.AAC.2
MFDMNAMHNVECYAYRLTWCMLAWYTYRRDGRHIVETVGILLEKTAKHARALIHNLLPSLFHFCFDCLCPPCVKSTQAELLQWPESSLAYQAKESNVAEWQRMHDGNNNASAIDLTGESEDAAQHPSSMITATPKRSHSRMERQLKDPPEHLLNTTSSKKYRREVLASHTSGEDDESEAIICGNEEEDPAKDSDDYFGQLIHSLEELEETEREELLREIQEWEENVMDEIMQGNSISEINQAAASHYSFQRPILNQPIAHQNQL